MREPFVKQRQPARPGSIPDVLEMFVNEVRFYRELAPVVGVRVPACFEATESDGATKLTLENLSHWRPGAEPVDAARALAGLHGRWQGRLGERWPWLRAPTAAADLVGSLFDSQWLTIRDRPDLSSGARELGDRLQSRVPEAEVRSARSGPETLVHGDASLRNMRTGPAGEIALLDWEDVGRGPGVADLAWLLLSSVDPSRWDETVAAYGGAPRLTEPLPAAAVQAFLSLCDEPVGSDAARAWGERLDQAVLRLAES